MFERFTRDDRMMLAFAMQEAIDLGHRRLGNDHVLLGMLCNARTPLFATLTEQGLTLAGAREAVRAYHDADDSDEAKDAQRSAAERYEEDREALRSIGIDLDKVREAVRDRFGDDLSEGWAERPERGRGRGRRGPDCGGPDRGPHEHGRGHGRRGRGRGRGRSEGFGPEFGPGFGPGGFGPGGFGPGDFGPDDFGPGGFGPGGPRRGYGPDGPFEPGRGRRGPRGRGARPRFAPQTREALEAAVRIARDRDDKLRAEYLLLGILDVADPASLAVITSATTADDLRAAILASLPEEQAGV